MTVDVAHSAEPAAEPLIDAGEAPGTWTPVPVPVPTYTLKASAPRREADGAEPVEHEDAAHPAEEVRTPEAAEPVAEVPSIDLNAVLARRRAV